MCFIEAHIVNETQAVGSIIEYELEMEVEGRSFKLINDPNLSGWVQITDSYKIDPIEGTKVDGPVKQEGVPDLMKLTARPMQQGHGVEGWLHFVVENINPLKLENNPARLKLPEPLRAIDGYGVAHAITKGWQGTRETRIAPDLHSN
jgi:hypothetical protein